MVKHPDDHEGWAIIIEHEGKEHILVVDGRVKFRTEAAAIAAYRKSDRAVAACRAGKHERWATNGPRGELNVYDDAAA